MNARPYQTDCLTAIGAAFERQQSALAVLGTGGGKTVIFAKAAHDWTDRRVLILAHREELLEQAAAKIEAICGDRPDIEKASKRADETIYGSSKIVVGSVQSMHQDRRLQSAVYDPSKWGLIIWDEAHHLSKHNKTYKKIYDHFRLSKHLGVTATADRSDGHGLGHFFADVVYRFDIKEMIAEGWLVPVKQRFVTITDLDFAKIPKKAGGDFADGELEEEMSREKSLAEVAAGLMLAPDSDRPTLVFAAGIRHAELLADILNRHEGVTAKAVHGGNSKYAMSSDERRRRIQEFRDGKFRYLCGCDIFYEGFDVPLVSRVAVARPMKARNRYAQAVGRGTRMMVPEHELDYTSADRRRESIAASVKPDLVVVDFVGLSHLSLDVNCNTAELLAGREDCETMRRAIERAAKSGAAVNLDELVAEERAKMKAEAEEVKRKRWEWLRIDRAKIESIKTDPFGRGFSVDAGSELERSPTGASEKQEQFLRKRGLWQDGMSKREASKRISHAILSAPKDKPTDGQHKILARALEPLDRSPAVASVVIDVLRQRNWKRLGYRLTRDRWAVRSHSSTQHQAVVRDPIYGGLLTGPMHDTQERCREWIQQRIEQEPVTA